MLNKNQAGLTLGILAALLHLVWAILVGIGIAKQAIDWIMPLHFVGVMFSITEFNFVNAVIFVVLGFICGYVVGWLFTAIWNALGKK